VDCLGRTLGAVKQK